MLGNTSALDLVKLIFNATAIANLADNAGSSPLTNLYLALHTADPGPGGDQTTSEAAYTGYARLAVPRTTVGFTCANASNLTSVINAALAQFAQCTAGSASVVFASVGYAASGGSKIINRCPVGSASPGLLFTVKTNDTLTIPGNVLAVDDRCVLNQSPNATFPAGATEGTLYWTKTVSGDDVTISATQGGAALDFTAVGGGIVSKVVPLSVSVNITPQFAAGQLKFIFK